MDGSFVVLLNKPRNKVFLVFRSDYPVWVLTGGGIEKGESASKAAIREAKEESNFEVKIIRSVGVYNVGNKSEPNNKIHFFEGRRLGGKFKPEYPRCMGKWFDVDKLPARMTSFSKRAIDDTLNQTRNYIEDKHSLFHLSDLKFFILEPRATIRYLLKTRKERLLHSKDIGVPAETDEAR
jgi:ADP-ribose pyrophosphatase YjhB (NUDIX family)